uniref:Regulatory myosin light chain n=1 Tax=Peripatoides novaezealandiae TaxID=49105 RepID=A0A0A7AAJ6_9BILA|nr:regulatory myosin light chain [Peripatoides novaezealandiae]
MDGRKEKTKKRAQRATSNVFAMFEQNQIAEFKEAFSMMDQNKDGFVDKDDLKDTFASLGRAPPDSEIDAMLNEASGPINFTIFLEDLLQYSQLPWKIDVLLLFSQDFQAVYPEDRLRELLTGVGDKFTDDDVSCAFKGAVWPYNAFSKLFTGGREDEAGAHQKKK